MHILRAAVRLRFGKVRQYDRPIHRNVLELDVLQHVQREFQLLEIAQGLIVEFVVGRNGD